ncbi:sulfotransferase [Novosphingobium sp.]|uniref:tetratricopeptide repeat-containing sulfotransferase family protein n=1 Tax=Novosphingobium sp. TaxID=1874826 RepID=UPI003D0F6756
MATHPPQIAPTQTVTGPTRSPLEGEIARLRALHASGNDQAVWDGIAPWLVSHPENRDVLLLAAIALRHLQRTDEAIAMLERLAELQPQYSLLHQELGLCHVARRDAPRAIAELQSAVALNAALPMSWRMLSGLHRMTGDLANAEIAARHSAHYASLPPPILHAKTLFSDGEIEPAEMMIREFLLAHGDHPEAMRLLAQIGYLRGVFDDAELLYAGALSLVPDHHEMRSEYVATLIARHKHALARDVLAPLMALDDQHHGHRTHAASVAVGLGEHRAAIALYRGMLAEIPESDIARRADMNMWLGHALKTVGDLPDAIAAYSASTVARPDFGEAWWSLANLKTYRFGDAELAVISQAETDPGTAPVDRIHLAFALGKALEDRGDHAGSWAAYARGNAARRAESAYSPSIFETNTREQKRVCTPAFFAGRAGWGDPAPDPIFVLGLPRAGSTLIEQILASHSQVEGTQELPNVHYIVHELQGRELDFENPRYPAILPELDAQAVRTFGEQYLADTRSYRTLGRLRFIDKMPNNFRHIGLIHLVLPNATIIDARRNPMDCCFSNLKQLFAQGQEFTYSMQDIARYYRTYLDLMRHWDTALPGRVLRVLNEDLIDDPEGQIRRMLDHCGLPFEDACLNFHQNTRSVRTPSSEQVRRPISRDGVDQWKPYAPWLNELRETLGDALETWRA